MNEEKNSISSYVYGVAMVIVFLCFAAFLVYLVYLLIVKASTDEFTDKTLIHAMFSLIFTVFIGTWLAKTLESTNAKKIEVYKVRQDISLTIIKLSGIILSTDDRDKQQAIELLHNENYKVKLFFDDETVRSVKSFLEESSMNTYAIMTDHLKKHLN